MYLPIRKRVNPPANDEPLDAITKEALDGSDEEDEWGGEPVGGEAGEKAESLADILGNGEVVELELGEAHEGLEGVGVVGEGVVVAGDGLDPDGGDEAQPFGGDGRGRGRGMGREAWGWGPHVVDF